MPGRAETDRADGRAPAGISSVSGWIFWLFGIGNFKAVMLVQNLFDLGTCLIVTDISRRVASERAARIAFAYGSDVSIPGKLCGRRVDRDSGDFLYRSRS